MTALWKCPDHLPAWLYRLLPGQWARLGDLWVGLVTVTPEAATEILNDHNDCNRPLSDTVARRIAAQITGGLWQMTGEPFIMDWDGNTQSFQHRARAIEISGIPVRTLAVYGVNPAVFSVIDSGHKKTNGDRFSVEGESHYSALAALCSRVDTFFQFGTIGRSVSMNHNFPRARQMVALWPSLRHSAEFATSRPIAKIFHGPSTLATLHWVFSKSDSRLAPLFFTNIAGYSIPRDRAWSGVRSFAEQLDSMKKDIAKISFKAIKAWNGLVTGREIKCLREAADEAFPLVHGWQYHEGIPVQPPPEVDAPPPSIGGGL